MVRELKEREIQKMCKDWLERVGLEPIRNNTGTFKKSYTPKGGGRAREHWVKCGREFSGDVLFCSMSGQWVELEIKTVTGQLSVGQKQRQKRIEQRGGLYLVIRSLEDLLRWQDKLMEPANG